MLPDSSALHRVGASLGGRQHCITLQYSRNVQQTEEIFVGYTHTVQKNGKDVEICSHGTLQQLQRCAHAAERLAGEEEEQQGRVVHPDGGNCLFHFFSHHFFAVYLRYRKQCTQPGGFYSFNHLFLAVNLTLFWWKQKFFFYCFQF